MIIYLRPKLGDNVWICRGRHDLSVQSEDASEQRERRVKVDEGREGDGQQRKEQGSIEL